MPRVILSFQGALTLLKVAPDAAWQDVLAAVRQRLGIPAGAALTLTVHGAKVAAREAEDAEAASQEYPLVALDAANVGHCAGGLRDFSWQHVAAAVEYYAKRGIRAVPVRDCARCTLRRRV